MALPTRSIYALDPATEKVRLVVQVTPEGWYDDELDILFAGLIPVLGTAGIDIALVVAQEGSFLLRRDEKAAHFDVDEIDTAEVVGPFPVDPDPAKLFDTVERWVKQVASDWQQFVPTTTLPKRVPEIVPLIVGAKLKTRDGSIGLPEDQVTAPVPATGE